MSETIAVDLKGKLGNFSLDCAFEVPLAGVTALYGPSGCGKTTVLRAIAGLNRFSGEIRIGDDCWQDANNFIPVYKRPLGYVFQEASLFPHLSVKKNLTFGMAKTERKRSPTFNEMVEFLNISRLIERAPHNLSGGERQRVAIGRALLSHPRLLLMDEPLSALDKRSRDEILPFLVGLRDRLSMPIIYITHDIYEVERLADTLVLMDSGEVIACGPLEEIQANPDLPLADTREAGVNLDGMVKSYDKNSGLVEVDVAGGTFVAPSQLLPIGKKMRIRIAANDVSLAVEKPLQSSILNIMPSRIKTVRNKGNFEVLAKLELGIEGKGAHFLSRLTRHSWEILSLHEGMNVYAQIKGVALIERNEG
ncbi:molybdenum ABC transporter ATP-binding protein [uncultured Bartonella sp.]|uniref:molybdenum ABC transporter ATP-binding protein n=1 Tax=uncultured Bartonella sp. TaxID=104108 RepID=UPI00262D4985|nr:molybdenum ABC transporter ATP-binding protein [uncultured Bartonella sp.]